MFKEHQKNLGVPWQNSTLAGTSANPQLSSANLHGPDRNPENPNESQRVFESGRISANLAERGRSEASFGTPYRTCMNVRENLRGPLWNLEEL